jgi:hypothetical protein
MKTSKRLGKRVPKTLRKAGPVGVALTVAQAAWAVRDHWHTLPPDRRARLQELLAASHGRPSNLSKSERRELRELIGGLKLSRLIRRVSRVTAGGAGRS